MDPDPTSSMVEMFQLVYSSGKIHLTDDPEDQAFRSAFGSSEMEKAGFYCTGLLASAAAAIRFPYRLVAFVGIAPLAFLFGSALPHPMYNSYQALLPRMARKYESEVVAYYTKVFTGPNLTWKARSQEEKKAEEKERSLRLTRPVVAKRELR